VDAAHAAGGPSPALGDAGSHSNERDRAACKRMCMIALARNRLCVIALPASTGWPLGPAAQALLRVAGFVGCAHYTRPEEFDGA
jgi:hypothetical protein